MTPEEIHTNWIPKIPGVTVQMASLAWVVPPLTLGQLRRLLPKVRELTDVGAGMGAEQIDTLCAIVSAALGRNYPEVTPDIVADMLDLGNAQSVLAAVLTGSGLKPGEARAAVGNGAISTDYSPPSADTAIP